MNTTTETYLRNVIFGVTDSLVSTVGLLAGIDAGGTTVNVIVLTGVVYAFVEAFSMAVGSFLSEESVEAYESDGRSPLTKPILGAVTMFVAFVVAAFIPLAPYLFISGAAAIWYSIGFSVVALFIVGMAAARVTKSRLLPRATQSAILGGAAILIGFLVGKFLK
jgi:VIT1/CCC1 family predicted Fe2+/Mn2+ transporter